MGFFADPTVLLMAAMLVLAVTFQEEWEQHGLLIAAGCWSIATRTPTVTACGNRHQHTLACRQ